MAVAIQAQASQPLTIDRREVCVLHGWVGRQVFQRDRHDLCEAPLELAPLEPDEPDDDEDCEPKITPFVYVDDGIEGKRSRRRRRDPNVARPHIISRKKRSAPPPDPEDGTDARMIARLREQRPKTRGDCADGARPCPWISCRHNLYIDVDPRTGALRLVFPDLEVHELVESCALDVAAWGGTTLDKVGNIMNLSRERIRQLEAPALQKLKLLSKDLENPSDAPEIVWPDH